MERRARAGRRLYPDAAAVAVGDPPADRQADAGAGVLLAAVEPAEHLENALGVALLDADAVVAYDDVPLTRLVDALDANLRRDVVARELDRVGDQVLQQLADLGRVALHGAERAMGDRRPALEDRAFVRAQHAFEDRVGIDRHALDLDAADARVPQQVVDQELHPLRAVDGGVDELVRGLVELASVAALQQLQVARDHPQRLAQVVRRDVGEVLQLGVDALEALGPVLELLVEPP